MIHVSQTKLGPTRSFLLVGCLILGPGLLWGCSKGSSRDSAEKPAASPPAATTQAVDWENFGAPIPDTDPVAAADLLRSPESYVGKTILLEGAVAEVCQTKGCWMTMQAADKEMRIKFKDYGFFVPKDCAGRTARLEGVLSLETTSVEEARHYLEDAGKHEEALKITEPVQSLTFLASGVRLKV